MRQSTFLYAILFVGATLVLSVIGIIVLSLQDHPTPDILQNLASGALAGLIGLLVNPVKAAGS